MTVATLDDVQGSLMRYLEDDEKPWVQALLDRAEALILSRMPDAVNRCRVDYSFSVIMRMVEAESVSRVLRAPGGGLYKYETEGTYTYSVNQAVASGILEITDRDWQALNGGASGWGVAGAEMDGYARRTHLLGALVAATMRRAVLGAAVPFGALYALALRPSTLLATTPSMTRMRWRCGRVPAPSWALPREWAPRC